MHENRNFRRNFQFTPKLVTTFLRIIQTIKHLTAKQCTSAPTLLSYTVERQYWDGFVPGGFLVTLFIEQVPGVPVDTIYWRSPPKVRRKIREAFKWAWLECLDAGFVNHAMSYECLSWDKKQNEKVYFTDWCDSEPPKKKDLVWTEVRYIIWNLAKPPRRYSFSRETNPYPDTSAWEM